MACFRRTKSHQCRTIFAGALAYCAAVIFICAGCASQDLVRGQAPGAPTYTPAPYATQPPAAPGYAAPSYSAPAYSPAAGPAGAYAQPTNVAPAYTPAPQGAPPAVNYPSPDTQPAPGETRVLQVQVIGARGAVTSKLPKLKTRMGEPYDRQAVEDDVRALSKTGRFIDIQPKVQEVTGGVIVIFQVVQRPIIQEIIIVGCENELRSSLLSKCELKAKDPLDPYAITEGRSKIEAYYHDHGFDRVHVSIPEGLNPGDERVVYKIDEGRQQKIWTTRFIGNHFESGARLETLIESKPPMFGSKYLWGGGFNGYADRKKIDEDVEKLTDFYRAFGYFTATVNKYWEFDEEEKWMYLTFVIDEGQRYKVRNISYIGEKVFSVETISKDSKLHAGDYYNELAKNKDLAKIHDLYGSYGFVFADIQPDRRLLDDSAQLDLIYSIKEGQRYRVGKLNITIKGENPHTSYATILDRMTLRPGDILDTTKLRNDERRLKFSGLYESKDPNKVPKIVFSTPPGMEDPDKELAERNRRPGWTGNSGSGGSSGSGSSSHPFGPSFGSDSSGSDVSGSASSGGSSYRGQAPDGEPDQVLDITFELPPRGDQPDQQAGASQPANQPVAVPHPPKPGERVEWIDPLAAESSQDNAVQNTAPQSPAPQTTVPQQNSSQPACGANSDQPAGLIIRGQEPTDSDWTPARQNVTPPQAPIVRGQEQAYGGVTPAPTGPDQSAGPSYAAPQPSYAQPQPNYAPSPNYAAQPSYAAPQAGPVQMAQVPSYPPSGSPPTYSPAPPVYSPPPSYSAPPAYAQAPSYTPPPSGYQLPPPNGSYPPGSYPQPAYPPGPAPQYGAYPQYGPAPQPEPVPTPGPGAPIIGQMRTDPLGLPYLDIEPTANEAQTGKLSVGVGVNSDAGLIGSIVVEEQNFDPFRWPSSWEDVREATAFRGEGDQLRIELAPGTEVQNYLISLRDPYLFHEPISLTNSISYFERYYDNWTDTRVSYNGSIGYYFTPDTLGSIGYNIERVRISSPTVPTPPEVDNALGWSFENGPTLLLQHDTRDDQFLPGSGHLVRYNFQYDFGRFDYWIQRVDLRQYFTLGARPDGSGKQVLGLGSTVGFSSNQTPVFDDFYAGGFSSLRGFAYRGVSPLDEGVAVGGDFEWLNTIEYNYPITADDVVRGVFFIDAGTVTTDVNQFTWGDVRVAPGFGFRLAIPALGSAPIALDFAFPVHRLPGDQGEIFSFSLATAH